MKGIIFDKDGTLLKFDSFWRPVTEHAVEYILRERKAPPGMKDRMMEAAGLDSGICGLIYRGTYAQLSEAFQNVLEEGGMDADRMGSLGNVFPVMFFLVAALVSLTAMTRMVEEQRTAIGTLKALGYGDGVITWKYLSYAMAAAIGGSILGVLVGSVLIPWIIMNAYSTALYRGLSIYLMPLNMDQAILAVAASVCSTGIATMAAAYRELRSKPAQLMRPKTPESGKRVA